MRPRGLLISFACAAVLVSILLVMALFEVDQHRQAAASCHAEPGCMYECPCGAYEMLSAIGDIAALAMIGLAALGLWRRDGRIQGLGILMAIIAPLAAFANYWMFKQGFIFGVSRTLAAGHLVASAALAVLGVFLAQAGRRMSD